MVVREEVKLPAVSREEIRRHLAEHWMSAGSVQLQPEEDFVEHRADAVRGRSPQKAPLVLVGHQVEAVLGVSLQKAPHARQRIRFVALVMSSQKMSRQLQTLCVVAEAQ